MTSENSHSEPLREVAWMVLSSEEVVSHFLEDSKKIQIKEEEFQKAFYYKNVTNLLKNYYEKYKPTPSASERIQKDSAQNLKPKTDTLDFYIKTFPLEDQILFYFFYLHPLSSDDLEILFEQSYRSLQARAEMIADELRHQMRFSNPEVFFDSLKLWKEKVPHDFKKPISSLSLSSSKKTSPLLRYGLEAFLVSILGFGFILTIPKMKTFFQKMMDRKMDVILMEEFISEMETLKNPEYTSEPDLPLQTATSSSTLEDQYSGDLESGSTSNDIRVGNSEIWRFNLRTESPKEMRKVILKMLKGYQTDSSPGAQGVLAPGGIQFDFLLPQDQIPTLKVDLEKIQAQNTPNYAKSERQNQDFFTWFKVRSKTSLPQGKSRVVIWLSQV